MCHLLITTLYQSLIWMKKCAWSRPIIDYIMHTAVLHKWLTSQVKRLRNQRQASKNSEKAAKAIVYCFFFINDHQNICLSINVITTIPITKLFYTICFYAHNFTRLRTIIVTTPVRVQKKSGFFLKSPTHWIFWGFWGFIGFFGQAGKNR